MSNSKPIFAYHDLRGIAYPVKLAMAYLGVDYTDKRYPLSPTGLEEWGGEKSNLGLDFPNLPYWKEGELHLTESRAILKHVARRYGNGVLMPSDPLLLANAEMVESVLWDVWFFLIWRCYHDNESFIEMLKRSQPKWELLNKFLGNKKWILGDKISYVDFMLYEVLTHYHIYDPEYLKPYPGLLGFMKNLEDIPAMKKYLASPAHIPGPCFHPMFMKHKVKGLTC